MEKKLRKNQRDDRRCLWLAREVIEEALCFFGLLAWMGFLMYLFLEAVFE